MKLRNFISVFLLLIANIAFAQDYFTIQNVYILGNQKTRADIIQRELGFSKGDSFPLNLLSEKLDKAKNQLLNTNLFTEVDVFSDSNQNIFITLNEDWYIWPHLILEFADRNFNQWWLTRDISRLNIGIDLRWKNFSGRNDQVNIQLAGGYTHHILLYYTRPFMDKKKHWGYGIGAKYSANREVWLEPVNDKINFFSNNNEFIIRRYAIQGDLTYRKGIFDKNILSYNYSRTKVSDTVISEAGNHLFLMNGNNQMGVHTLSYTHIYDKRDIRSYPFKGYFLKAKTGLELYENGSQNFRLDAHAYGFLPLSKRIFASSGFVGSTSTLQLPPYENFRALGYGNVFVRGYEYYVIDGKDFALMRNNIKYALIKDKKYKMNFAPKAFRELTLSVMGGFFYDFGFVNSPFVYSGNALPNTLLQGYGFGIDWVLYYNRVIRTEYAFNALGEQGFYLSFYAPI